ncbi:Lsr2 dimerization domain-containing protein [Pseudonocardia sp. T1-2H]|uniref:Lsr2 dimerization domain-containing protein n=1 Tax=Pseudonocardia sp. T1-2H TaxID=3128899 RepID=UPI0031013F85
MAQQVNTILVDFEDGARADETVDFGLDGRQYEVDLSRADAEGLRQSSIPSRPHDLGQVGRLDVPESGVVTERGTPVLLQHADGHP